MVSRQRAEDQRSRLAESGLDPDQTAALMEAAGLDFEIDERPERLNPEDLLRMDLEEITPETRTALLQKAQVYPVYETRTGTPHLINENQIPTAMSRRWEDGTLVFTAIKPDAKDLFLPPVIHPCWIHPEHPDFEQHMNWGAVPSSGPCNKKLLNPVDVEMHMQRFHSREYKIISESRQKDERDDWRARQDRLEVAQAEDRAVLQDLVRAFSKWAGLDVEEQAEGTHQE